MAPTKLATYVAKLEEGLGEAAIDLRAGGGRELIPVPVCSAGFERITSAGVEMNVDALMPWLHEWIDGQTLKTAFLDLDEGHDHKLSGGKSKASRMK